MLSSDDCILFLRIIIQTKLISKIKCIINFTCTFHYWEGKSIEENMSCLLNKHFPIRVILNLKEYKHHTLIHIKELQKHMSV